MRFLSTLLCCLLLTSARAEPPPVLVGIDAEFGVIGSTSAQAIRMGARIAIDEINAAGGVLGGRKLALVEKDNRSVPARSLNNLRELAADPNVVAVLCGKFSPVVVEALPEIHRLKLPLLDPWAAADPITDHEYRPGYVFRLSLRDSWAIEAMVRHAKDRKLRKLGLLLPNTEWGRSSLRAAERIDKQDPKFEIAGSRWYNWGDPTLVDKYQSLRAAGAEAIIVVANDREAGLLVREVAGLPKAERLPLLSHWGVTGGSFFASTGPALKEVDFAVVQTYSFLDAKDPVARRVIESARQHGAENARRIPSPVGVAHAYDLVHLLAKAVKKAGSTSRPAIRDALENLGPHAGLVRRYARPFAPGRYDALTAKETFMARYADDGAIERIPGGR